MTGVMREDGVSPVLGVILMVAITVILAAVIASFVFGMTDTVNPNPYVGVIARQVGDDISVTYAVTPSGGETITNLSVSVDGEIKGFIEDPAIGESLNLDGEGTPANDHIIVVATYTNGKQAIVLDTYV